MRNKGLNFFIYSVPEQDGGRVAFSDRQRRHRRPLTRTGTPAVFGLLPRTTLTYQQRRLFCTGARWRTSYNLRPPEAPPAPSDPGPARLLCSISCRVQFSPINKDDCSSREEQTPTRTNFTISCVQPWSLTAPIRSSPNLISTFTPPRPIVTRGGK